jgi:hypothetical protein
MATWVALSHLRGGEAAGTNVDALGLPDQANDLSRRPLMADAYSTGLACPQTLPPAQIARGALRAAALAPTVYDALDVAGDGLRYLAGLARAEEARHA